VCVCPMKNTNFRNTHTIIITRPFTLTLYIELQSLNNYHRMKPSYFLLALCYTTTVFFSSCTFDGESLDGNLEDSVETSPCVRLFTNKGDIGCRTPDGKRVGALYEIRNVQDIYDIDSIEVDFAIVTPAKYFDSSLISILAKKTPQGVIVYDGDWVPEDGKYSTDVNTTQGVGTPQEDYTYNNEYLWNNYGNGIMYKSLP
jgi:hypothetical protein